MAKKPKPKVVLDPDLVDDDDGIGSPIPDDDGWVYLKRSQPAQEEQRAKSPPAKRGLVEAVRSSLTTGTPGFQPWYRRVPEQHLAELLELKRSWLAGELGTNLNAVAVQTAHWLNENGISTIGRQGVIAWLKKRD